MNGKIEGNSPIRSPEVNGGHSSTMAVPLEGQPLAPGVSKADAQNNIGESGTGKVSPTADNTGVEQSK